MDYGNRPATFYPGKYETNLPVPLTTRLVARTSPQEKRKLSVIERCSWDNSQPNAAQSKGFNNNITRNFIDQWIAEIGKPLDGRSKMGRRSDVQRPCKMDSGVEDKDTFQVWEELEDSDAQCQKPCPPGGS